MTCDRYTCCLYRALAMAVPRFTLLMYVRTMYVRCICDVCAGCMCDVCAVIHVRCMCGYRISWNSKLTI